MYELDLFFAYKLLFAAELMIAEGLIAYRLPRRRRFVPRVILSVVAVLALTLAVPVINDSVAWMITMYFGIFAITVAALTVCFAAPLQKILFCAIAGYTAQHMGYTLFELFVSVLGPDSVITAPSADGSNPLALHLLIPLGSGRSGVLLNPFTVLFYVLFYGVTYFLFRLFTGARLKRSENMQLRSVSMLVFVVLIVVTDVVISAFVSARAAESFDRTYIILVDVATLLCCALALYLQFSVALVYKLEQDLDVLNRLYEQEVRQYALVKDNIGRIDIKCHDLKHQIRRIGAKSSVSADALAEMENIISVYDSRVKTGNEALDIILTEKSLLCNSEHITLSCIADGKLLSFMSDGDIYAMFGNLVDNAIEAVMKLKEEDRSIGLKIDGECGIVHVSIYNRYAGEIRFDGGMPLTGKADRSAHGYGLRSVAMLVEKYGGEMSIDANGGVFSVGLAFWQDEE